MPCRTKGYNNGSKMNDNWLRNLRAFGTLYFNGLSHLNSPQMHRSQRMEQFPWMLHVAFNLSYWTCNTSIKYHWQCYGTSIFNVGGLSQIYAGGELCRQYVRIQVGQNSKPAKADRRLIRHEIASYHLPTMREVCADADGKHIWRGYMRPNSRSWW
jgi:hypothetical protein